MTGRNTKMKIFSKKNKFFKFFIFSLALVLIVCGIQSAYAYYYNESDSLPILSNLIGDFDLGDGDINIVVFKETNVGSDEFVKTYAVPSLGYSLNIRKTTCQNSTGQKIECNKDDPTSACNYTYDETTREIKVTSNQKATCKFYFTKNYNTDIELYIMMQDVNGTHTYNDKTYKNVDNIPAFGFNFSGYNCQSSTSENPSRIELDSETGKLKVYAKQKDVCYAYYDGNLQNADIIANIFVQKEVGGDYTKVNTIPTSQKFKISETERSYCHKTNGSDTGSVPTYKDFLIDIPKVNQKQICEIYLDIDNS